MATARKSRITPDADSIANTGETSQNLSVDYIQKRQQSTPLAPWLQNQLETLLTQRGHAWLLAGASGLGQLDLALALAKTWLCAHPTPQGACTQCSSCHAIAVNSHADLRFMVPETLALERGWPLSKKSQKDIETRKPSREIRVDDAREMVAYAQVTHARGVILVYPAERMNTVTANAILKTLEEPPSSLFFVLATEATHQLLPTIRSRCQSHAMVWPGFDEALDWLTKSLLTTNTPSDNKAQANSSLPQPTPAERADLHTLLAAAGGRPADVHTALLAGLPLHDAAQHWRRLPHAMAEGRADALADWTPAQIVAMLQKLCHDLMALRAGGKSRFFDRIDLPDSQPSWSVLAQWAKALSLSAQTAEHPFSVPLLREAMVSQAEQVMRLRS